MENPSKKDDRPGKSRQQSNKEGKGNNSNNGRHSGKEAGKSQQTEKPKVAAGKANNKVNDGE